MTTLPQFSDIERAQETIAPYLHTTPLTFAHAISEITGLKVYIKWENKHRTGSFKERGACNFLQSQKKHLQSGGVIAASAGNHALALSYHAARLTIPCTIVMPRYAPLTKAARTRGMGANTILHGLNFDEALEQSAKLSAEKNLTRVPAFDHPLIIAGQGTMGLEITNELPAVDCVIIPVGGGGLISGSALTLKGKFPKVRIIGVQSEWATTNHTAQTHPEKTKVLQPATIADGIAVKRVGEITRQMISEYVDSLVQVTENEIAAGVLALLQHEHQVVEGAGAAGLAALLSGRAVCDPGSTVVVAVTGSNIDLSVLSRLIEGQMSRRDRLLRVTLAVPDRPGSLHLVTSIVSELQGNILSVVHDRSFSELPGDVDINMLIEVKDAQHRSKIIAAFESAGMTVRNY